MKTWRKGLALISFVPNAALSFVLNLSGKKVVVARKLYPLLTHPRCAASTLVPNITIHTVSPPYVSFCVPDPFASGCFYPHQLHTSRTPAAPVLTAPASCPSGTAAPTRSPCTLGPDLPTLWPNPLAPRPPLEVVLVLPVLRRDPQWPLSARPRPEAPSSDRLVLRVEPSARPAAIAVVVVVLVGLQRRRQRQRRRMRRRRPDRLILLGRRIRLVRGPIHLANRRRLNSLCGRLRCFETSGLVS